MGKQKKTEDESPVPDPHKGIQTNFRFIDPAVLAKVDEYARRERRSRNLMLNILVEEAIARREAEENDK